MFDASVSTALALASWQPSIQIHINPALTQPTVSQIINTPNPTTAATAPHPTTTLPAADINPGGPVTSNPSIVISDPADVLLA